MTPLLLLLGCAPRSLPSTTSPPRSSSSRIGLTSWRASCANTNLDWLCNQGEHGASCSPDYHFAELSLPPPLDRSERSIFGRPCSSTATIRSARTVAVH